MKAIFKVLLTILMVSQNLCFGARSKQYRITSYPGPAVGSLSNGISSTNSQDNTIRAHLRFGSTIANITNTNNQLTYTINHKSVIGRLKISPDNSIIVTASIQHDSIKVWDAQTGGLIDFHNFNPEANVMLSDITFDEKDPTRFYVITETKLSGCNSIYVFTNQFSKNR